MKRAFYDFAVSPYSFDFAQFLLCAKAKECDEIVIVPGKRMVRDRDGNIVEFQKCTPGEQEYRLNNLILGLAPKAIVCQSRDEAATLWHEGCFPEGYTVGRPVQSHTLGAVMNAGKIWPFMPTPEAMAQVEKDGWKRDKMAVITMRSSRIKPLRNSSTDDWIKAADWLRTQGFTPVFIPDTDALEARFGDHESCPQAATDVQYRIALYELAALNLGVNNGPMALNFFSKRPMLYFKPITQDYPESSIEGWRKNMIPYQSQPPWFTAAMRIIWTEKDDFDTIRAAVETWQRAVTGDRDAWPPAVAPMYPVKGVVNAEMRGQNMGKALDAAKANGWPQMKRKPLGDEKISIVCYGPSLADTWRDIKRPILTVSGAHDFLIERGIVPDYHMDCDPREHKAQFVKNAHPDVCYLMATCLHPVAWQYLAGRNVKLWHLHNGPETDEWLAIHDPGANRLGGGTTAGARAFEVASMLGYKRFEVHGMDCSFRGEHRHAGKHGGKQQNEVEAKVGDKWYRSSPQMIEAAREVLNPFIANYDVEVFFHGDGLMQQMVRTFKDRFGVIETREIPQQEAA